MVAHSSKNFRSFALVFSLCLLFMVNAVKAFDCPCFTASDLSSFNVDNIDLESSCHESHATESGIALIMKQSPDETYASPPVAYNVEFGHHQHSCLVGGNDVMTVPTRKMAEDCADLIRKKCADIGQLAEV